MGVIEGAGKARPGKKGHQGKSWMSNAIQGNEVVGRARKEHRGVNKVIKVGSQRGEARQGRGWLCKVLQSKTQLGRAEQGEVMEC